MKNILTATFTAIALLVGVSALSLAGAQNVSAVNAIEDVCTDADAADSVICKNKGDSAGTVLKTVINTLLFITGALSVVMIIVGGMRYTVSRGDAASVSSAKNTIMYAVVGLLIASIAFAIVNWVMDIF